VNGEQILWPAGERCGRAIAWAALRRSHPRLLRALARGAKLVYRARDRYHRCAGGLK
jgi:hypothetical protein